MTHPDQDKDVYRQLIHGYLDGSLSPNELQKLEAVLRSSADARDELRRFATIEEGLADFAMTSALPESTNELQNLPKQPNAAKIAQPRGPKSGWLSFLMWAAAASVLFGLLRFASERQNITPVDQPQLTNAGDAPIIPIPLPDLSDPADVEIKIPQQTYVACLIDEFDSEFDEDQLDPSSGFSKGNYILKQGTIHLRFNNGADMVLEAPARFEILDDMNFQLHDGKMRAHFPPSARGFRVGTPGVEYYDMGTELGVYADSLEMRSELHVFEGNVNTMFPDEAAAPEFHSSGQAVVYRYGVMQEATVDQSQFVKPGLIGYRRWQRFQVALAEHPDVIGYFPFFKTSNGTLHNHAFTRPADELMPDGTVASGTWVTGRWPQKRALMFEMENDHVELDIPGEFDELTFAVWMKLDRIDHSHNAILNSDGWQSGAVHWQLNRSGGPWITPYGAANPKINNCVPIGKWVQLTSTLSKTTGKGKTYLNGELISETEFAPDVVIKPGKCRLGNWLKFGPNPERRTMAGRIDELLIFNKSLTALEVRELVNQGKPTAQWNSD